MDFDRKRVRAGPETGRAERIAHPHVLEPRIVGGGRRGGTGSGVEILAQHFGSVEIQD